MIEQMKIGVELNLKGNIAQKLKALHDSLDKFQKKIEKLNPHLVKFYEASTVATEKIGELARVSQTAFTSMERGLTSSISKMDILASKATKLNAALGGGGKAGGEGGAGRHRGSGIHAHPLSIGGFGFTGAAMALGAPLILGKKGFHENLTYQQTLAQFEAQGFKGKDVAKVNQFAMSSNIRGISKQEMLKAVVDAAMATGNVNSAIAIAPTLAMAYTGNQLLFQKSFSRQQEQKLIRFAEMRGGSDVGAIRSSVDLGQQMFAATGGRMGPDQLLNFLTMANTAAYHVTDRGYLRMTPVLQELGGFRSGTGFQTGFNQLLTGKGMSTAAAAELSRIGLLDPGKVVYDKIGRHLKTKPGALKKEFADILQTDPVGFVEKVLLPQMKKAGITDEMGQTQEVGRLFDRTFARLVSVIIKNLDKINRMFPLHQEAFTAQSTFTKGMALDAGKVKALTAAFDNFELAIGKLISPGVIKGMDMLTSFLETLTKALNFAMGSQNPGKYFDFNKFAQSANGAPSFDTIVDKFKSLFSGSDASNMNQPHSESTKGAMNANGEHKAAVYLDSHQVGYVMAPWFSQNMNRIMQGGGLLSTNPSIYGSAIPVGSRAQG